VKYLPFSTRRPVPTRRVVLAWRRSFTRYEAIAACATPSMPANCPACRACPERSCCCDRTVHIQPIRHFCWSLSMKTAQPGILAPVPPQGRYLFFTLKRPSALGEALTRLAPLVDGPHAVVGIGSDVVAALGATVPGLRAFAALKGPRVEVPATPTALWCWLRGTDRGKLVHATRAIEKALAPALWLERAIEAFRHGRGPNGHGRDLTGYEDGTENPEDAAAEKAALAHRQGAGLNGSSFVAVQQWVHDLDAFESMGTREQDNMVGRRRRDNHELDDAPASAHVKRTAQESFKPEAFVLRRSMPWAYDRQYGLMFVAFGKSFDAFEAQMRRMAGLDDGIVDAMFQISRPVTGAHFGPAAAPVPGPDPLEPAGGLAAVAVADAGGAVDRLRRVSGLAPAGGVHTGHHPDAQCRLLHQRCGRP
jgi:putative iron-dependent peroxidase